LGVTTVCIASLAAAAAAAAASVMRWGPWVSDGHQWSQWSGTKFGQLIIRKIIEIVAARSHILGSNTPNSISARAPPQTPLRELTALPQTP